MKLLKLGQIKYTVYAVYDEDGACPVLESLQKLGRNNNAATRMLHKLMTYIPEAGPNFRNSEKVKRLKGAPGIAEFREQPKHGPKVRVLFFLDGDRIIVCTDAFEKRNEPHEAEIEAAEYQQRRYFEAKDHKRIEIETLENIDG